jgi:hypothetical protein
MRLALAASVIAAATDVFYLWLIVHQGDGFSSRVVFVALYIAGIVLAVGSVGSARLIPIEVRIALLAASTGGLLALGVLGLFSIGLPLLTAGGFSHAVWIRLARSSPRTARSHAVSAAAFAGTAGLLIGGIAVTH